MTDVTVENNLSRVIAAVSRELVTSTTRALTVSLLGWLCRIDSGFVQPGFHGELLCESSWTQGSLRTCASGSRIWVYSNGNVSNGLFFCLWKYYMLIIKYPANTEDMKLRIKAAIWVGNMLEVRNTSNRTASVMCDVHQGEGIRNTS